MKKYNLGIIAAVLMIGISCFSCKKNNEPNAPFQVVDSSMAYLKVVHAAPFFRTSVGAADTFNVFINSLRVGVSTFSYNSSYPLSTNTATPTINNTYIAVAPGQQTIKLSTPGIVATDSISIITLTKSFGAGKFYTLFITDSLKTATRDTARMLVQDVIPPAMDGYVNIRFAHLAYNDTLNKMVDVYSYARNAAIVSNIKPGVITGFSALGYNIQATDTFYVRRSGTTQVLAKLAFTNSTLGAGNASAANKRCYTLYFKGDATATTGTKARSLGIYLNQ